MIIAIKTGIGLFPVFLFLLAFIFFDSYKLVRPRSVFQTIFMGGAAGLICFGINTFLLARFSFNVTVYSRYIAPVIEECMKAVWIAYLIRAKKIGFMVDGAIYGFAVGAGFAFVENVYALYSIQNPNLLIWIIRGFGTAVMHGGTTSLFSILAAKSSERGLSLRWRSFIPIILIAVALHSFFNHFFFNPLIMTIAQLMVLPALNAIVFTRSEKALQDWLEVGMDTDVSLMEYIIQGKISETKIGKYLRSLKNRFPGEIMADMLCFLRIHLELAIRAKGILMMQGAGFRIPADPEIRAKFTELQFLEKSIGKTGRLALLPLLHTSHRDLWQIYLIDKK
jgi:RsiW-degrading membrane proteinase PrsW (M82 family)